MRGHVFFTPERVLYAGPGVAAGLHAHHAVQICLPLSGSLRLRSSRRARWHTYDGAVIPSDLPHESDTPVARLIAIWLDAETPEAKRLVQCGQSAIAAVAPAALGAMASRLDAWWDALCDGRRSAAILDDVLGALVPGGSPGRLLDPRVARARDLLDSAPLRRLKLADLAASVSLSPSRLAHLFRSEVGLPVRRYRLWLRLRDAVGEMTRGATSTEAAHAAGFADAPHLDRTFRRMLGFTPSALRRASTFVQDAQASVR